MCSRLVFFLVLTLVTPSPVRADNLVIHNATVIDGTGAGPRSGTDVVIEGARISAVSTVCRHPPGARVIDGTDLFVVPGFIDMHVHLLEHGRNEKGDIPPRVDWNLVRQSLRLLLDHGITTVRDPGSETESAVTLRRMLQEGTVDGPRLITAGRIINASAFNPEPFMPVRDADEIRREIRWQKAAGVDFIKIYSSMTAELTKVAIDEAHGLGLPIMGHLQRTSWTEAARMGIDAIGHGASWSPDLLPDAKRADYPQSMFGRVYWLENLDLSSKQVQTMIGELARAGVVVDPTLIAYHTKFFGNDWRWLANPDNKLLPPSLIAGWKAGSFTRDWTAEQYAAAQKAWPKMLSLVRRMFEGGVRLVVGTDAPTAWIVPGASFHDELTFLRDTGIPASAIIRMATHDAARALRLDNETGSIRPGLRADILLLTANPLEKIENTRAIATVIQSGKVVHEKSQ